MKPRLAVRNSMSMRLPEKPMSTADFSLTRITAGCEQEEPDDSEAVSDRVPVELQDGRQVHLTK